MTAHRSEMQGAHKTACICTYKKTQEKRKTIANNPNHHAILANFSKLLLQISEIYLYIWSSRYKYLVLKQTKILWWKSSSNSVSPAVLLSIMVPALSIFNSFLEILGEKCQTFSELYQDIIPFY